MNLFRADLHCHSTCSDGVLKPSELVKLAVEMGLNALSITDHDSIDAYQTALTVANAFNLKMISGVEFSSILGQENIHILGYAFDLNNRAIKDFCDKHQLRRRQRNNEILTLLAKQGMIISEEELLASAGAVDQSSQLSVIGRPHIAKLMIEKKYVHDIREAFNKYLGEGRPCYSKGNFFTPEETIDVIHKANGFAIIAHPHLIESSKTVVQLLKMDFDGIECYYSRFSAAAQERWLKIANNRNWLITGGSDFHGESIKPMVTLGCSWVNEERFNILQKRFIENQNTI